MERVTVQDLKRNLSGCLKRAAEGRDLVVTRHRKPWVHVTPASERGLHVGDLVGRAYPASPFKTPASRGRFLEVLLRDRAGR